VAGNREGALPELREAIQAGWRVLNEPPNEPRMGSLQGEHGYERLIAEVEADVDRMRTWVEREGW
jgi:hypothetical protein